MKISFDPDKDEKTRRERGFSLVIGAEIIRNRVVTRADKRFDYGKHRFLTYGYVDKRLFVCVFTLREETIRIISVRKANDREIAKYGNETLGRS